LAEPTGSALTTTEAALLGLLVLEGPQSPYDLLREVAGSVGFFFAPARSHVYDVLPRLERHGWARHTLVEQASRPDKRVYRATAAGRRAVTAWVAEPDGPDADRSVILLKVYFGALVPSEVSVERLEALRARATQALERYREIDARHVPVEGDLFPMITLRHGIERTWSTIRWCEDALARIRASAPDVVRSGI
jgi:DNA-binding PadR family transcriptional regulator